MQPNNININFYSQLKAIYLNLLSLNKYSENERYVYKIHASRQLLPISIWF